MTQVSRAVVVGTIVGVHGLKGEVKVAPANGDPGRFRGVESVLVREHGRTGGRLRCPEPSLEEMPVEGQWAQAGKGHAIVKLAGVDNAEAAERLRGAELLVAEHELPPLAEGEYYSFMLVGMECVDEGGGLLGKVSEVLDRPANDVIVVEAADGGSEYLVPAVEDYVVDVDLNARRLTVRNRPGLR